MSRLDIQIYFGTFFVSHTRGSPPHSLPGVGSCSSIFLDVVEQESMSISWNPDLFSTMCMATNSIRNMISCFSLFLTHKAKCRPCIFLFLLKNKYKYLQAESHIIGIYVSTWVICKLKLVEEGEFELAQACKFHQNQ